MKTSPHARGHAPDPSAQLTHHRCVDRGEPSLDAELESDACYFNNQRFDIGNYVHSGDELLHCTIAGMDQGHGGTTGLISAIRFCRAAG